MSSWIRIVVSLLLNAAGPIISALKNKRGDKLGAVRTVLNRHEAGEISDAEAVEEIRKELAR